MNVYIMRHGEAGSFASSDAERTLTSRGETQSLQVAKAVVQQGVNHFDLVLVSPYIRAQQTWDIIKGQFSAGKVEECADITPYGQSEDVYQYVCAIAETQQPQSVLLVSHLPLVGYLTAEFVNDMTAPMFPTSGFAAINFDLESSNGELMWHIAP
ncbi:phosphohistidine phosphatase SixA [Vibrio sp. UCD-FRSSP16_10]|uniref:phosphohistidine phosphatase SixA n=1 Tax=unclassified Vibrio TaxID=2614977 RepID=UPI0007FE7A97|nr:MULTISPECIES: phosphohistidine phosphatase SixA [unclassified Vibrio]OBT15874.1 phosphohistidine phosphatase SixA [Vibrio sp. UCD-FRSSP16_10]OBT17768.1 phosphohistidine phosphatase SixA [Vibrio sp. UCD-FRSSP16_30]